jgi:hypothetical protein
MANSDQGPSALSLAPATHAQEASPGGPRGRGGTADRYPIPAIRGDSTALFAVAIGVILSLWVAAWPFLTLAFINHYDSSDAAWVEGLYQRKDLLASRHPIGTGGRIIIVGGSGALFGIDAELIERKLGVTTLNYATHAGLGAYILDRARTVIHPGDTVLLCPEYEQWYNAGTDLSDVEWAYVCTWDKRYIWSRGIGPALRTLYSQPASAYGDALLGWRDRFMGFDDGTTGPHNLAMVDACGDLRDVPPHRAFVPPGGPGVRRAGQPGRRYRRLSRLCQMGANEPGACFLFLAQRLPATLAARRAGGGRRGAPGDARTAGRDGVHRTQRAGGHDFPARLVHRHGLPHRCGVPPGSNRGIDSPAAAVSKPAGRRCCDPAADGTGRLSGWRRDQLAATG